jgi:hypothetical protein
MHSCAIDGFDVDAMGKLITFPDEHAVDLMITVIIRSQESFYRTGKLTLQKSMLKIHSEPAAQSDRLI